LVGGWMFRLDTDRIAAARIEVYDIRRGEREREVGSVSVTDREALCRLVRAFPQSTRTDWLPVEGYAGRYYIIHFIGVGGNQPGEMLIVIPNADKRTGVDVL